MISNKRTATEYALVLLGFAATIALFWPGLVDMVKSWDREEYSHGYLIPLVAI